MLSFGILAKRKSTLINPKPKQKKQKKDISRLSGVSFGCVSEKRGGDVMTNISIYDDTAKILEDTAEKNGTTVAEIIDELMNYLEDLGRG